MKRAQQKLRTRKAIKDAFIDLLKIKPIDQISITELAQKADVDRKTVYLYYPTVYDIIKEIENSIIEGLNQILANNKTADWKFFLRGLNEIMEQDLQYYTIIANDKKLAFLVDDCTNILIDIISKSVLQTKKCISDHDDIIINYTAHGILGVYEDWLKSTSKIPLEELINILGDLLNTTAPTFS